jgi:lipoprotein-anchoring transpeptidase ErfK/SrfK
MNQSSLFKRLLCAAIIAGISVAPATSDTSKDPAVSAEVAPDQISEAERRLADMGYLTGPADDRIDDRSRYGLFAFQRVELRKPTGRLTAPELQAIKAATPPRPLERNYPHLEVDLARQVLFVVDASGDVSLVLPVSSGSGKLYTSEGRTRRAVTPRGRFRVYRKVEGWRKSALGLLYYPNYLIDGVAIHGSPEIPNYPASHGCIRIPIPAARELSDITPVGTVVIVHDGSPELP